MVVVVVAVWRCGGGGGGVVCVHVVLCVVWFVSACACGVVVRVVWCVVKLGTREKAPCVDSKRLRVYVQDVHTEAF